MQARSSGQALSEYTLLGGLIAVIIIAGLINLGSNLNTSVSTMLSAPSQKQQANLVVTPVSVPVVSNGGSMPLPLTTNSGQPILTSMPPVNLKTVVQTNGANGTTSLLSNRLISIAQQLQQSGELTPEQSNLFIKLANQGHRMANIERLLEQAGTMASDTESYRQVRLTLDGKQYAPDELHNMLGWKDAQMHDFMLQSPADAINKLPEKQSVEIKAFLALYTELAQSEALQNPQVKSSVDELVTQIVYLSDVTKSASAALIRGDWSVPMEDIIVSKASDMKSANICEKGQQTDTGKHCN